MNKKIQPLSAVEYYFKNSKKETVTVKAKVLDIYNSIYGSSSDQECSIMYEYLGDTIVEHGISIDSDKINPL